MSPLPLIQHLVTSFQRPRPFTNRSLRQPPLETHSIGFTAEDADGLTILPQHVQRYRHAVDTSLTLPLQPGDQQIVLDDASGWSSIDVDPFTRSLAWYGYQDANGVLHDDYTYTRNVAVDEVDGLWPVHGIVGNTIQLSEPWAGPSLASGTAIRNAVAGDALFPAVLDNAMLTTSTQRLSATVSGSWQNGVRQVNAFPPGTARIRAAATLNQATLHENDIVVLESFSISPTPTDSVATDPDTHQYIVDLDVLSNDLPTSDLATSGVWEIVSATATVGNVVVLDNVLRYEAVPWFVGTDSLTYTVRDPDSSDEWTENVSVSVRGTNVGQDAALALSLTENESNQAIARDPRAFDDGLNSSLGSYSVVSGTTLHADGVKQLDLLQNDDINRLRSESPKTVSLARGPSHGALSLNPDGTFSYWADDEFVGKDSFEYEVFDGLRTDTAVATIRVFGDASELVLANLADLSIALEHYHSAYKNFPGYYRDEDGVPLHSWRVDILPFLGYHELFDEFRLGEPWDSPHNLSLADRMPDIFGDGMNDLATTRLQWITSTDRSHDADFRSIGLYSDSRLGFRNTLDGLSNTLFVVQTGADRAVPWTAPLDAAYDFDDPLNTLGTIDETGIPVVFMDGTTHILPADIDESVFVDFASRSSRELYSTTPRNYFRQIAEQTGQAAVEQYDEGGARQDQYLQQIGDAIANYVSFHTRTIRRLTLFAARMEQEIMDSVGECHLLPYHRRERSCFGDGSTLMNLGTVRQTWHYLMRCPMCFVVSATHRTPRQHESRNLLDPEPPGKLWKTEVRPLPRSMTLSTVRVTP